MRISITSAALICLFIGCEHRQSTSQSIEERVLPDAEVVITNALTTAKEQDKRVLVHVGSPGCGWCKVLEAFFDENQELFSEDYVILKIDTQEMENGSTVADRLRADRRGGIPWMVILDSEGNELVSSFGPDGNIGCPIRPEETAYFVAMIEKTRKNLSTDGIAKIAEKLEENAVKHRRS